MVEEFGISVDTNPRTHRTRQEYEKLSLRFVTEYVKRCIPHIEAEKSTTNGAKRGENCSTSAQNLLPCLFLPEHTINV